MIDQEATLSPPLLTTALVPAVQGSRFSAGELPWCSPSASNNGQIAVSSVTTSELRASPEGMLAPGYENYSLVGRLARLGHQLDPSGAALAIINNSLLLDGIHIGPIAMRREQGTDTTEDAATEERIEAILWATAQSMQAASVSMASARMARRLPWAKVDMVAVLRVSQEAGSRQEEPRLALSG